MKRALVGLVFMMQLRAQQSALDPAGLPAQRIALLTLFLTALLGLVFAIVVAITAVCLFRRHRGINQEPLEQTHRPSDETEHRLGVVIAMASGVTIAILLGLVIVSAATGRANSAASNPADSLAIEITGNQWWWYVRYPNADPSRILVTANELHIPVGRPVMIRGSSNDVIHSFWVPNLQGKRDLIPSHVSTDWIEADRPGQYRGQCAEYCGLQHAHMALWVVAEPREEFEAWMSRQLRPSAEPSDPAMQQGRQVFLASACPLCHTIQGTPAAGQVGPDLTHLASRLTIAAGTLPNNKRNLGDWINDPQNIKPGTHMPNVPVKAEDMQPLVEYLESLQ